MEIAELLGYEEEVEVASKINEIIRELKSSIENLTQTITRVDYQNLRIGDPVPTLDFKSVDAPTNCIWLKGDEKRIILYPKLHDIYGDAYNTGNEQEGFFRVPNIKDRVLWGGSEAGYIEAGLPNITGSMQFSNQWWSNSATGAFAGISYGATNRCGDGGSYPIRIDYNMDASRSSSVYKDDVNTVQPPAIKVRYYTRYQ